MSTIEDLITLNSAMTQLMRRIRRIDEEQGVGRARLSALAVLHFGGECSSSELADFEMVSRATMHHVITGLEKDGLVKRKPDAKDARRQIIHLTRRGVNAIEKAHEARIAYLGTLAADLNPAQLTTTATVLDHLRNNASLVNLQQSGNL